MINLITPPDILYDKNISILLIHPSKLIKEQINDMLKDVDKDINIYLHETEEEYEWVLNLHRMCDFVISFHNTFWLTNGDNMYYNKISNNRIFNLDWIGGKLEKTT